jgi:hypothetical protein
MVVESPFEPFTAVIAATMTTGAKSNTRHVMLPFSDIGFVYATSVSYWTLLRFSKFSL